MTRASRCGVGRVRHVSVPAPEAGYDPPSVGWTLFYMLVILKIPIIALLCLVWWAVKQEPEPAEGDSREPLRRGPDHPRGPRKPTPPRRGPHAEPPPVPPQRVRAKGKRVERTHG
jgi:hypothetical protein